MVADEIEELRTALEDEKHRVNQLATELAQARSYPDLGDQREWWQDKLPSLVSKATNTDWIEQDRDGWRAQARGWKDEAEKAELDRDIWKARAENAEHDLELLMPDSLKRGMAQAAAGEVRERPIADGWDEIARERDTWQERAKDAEADLAAVSHERDAWRGRFESAITERDNETARTEDLTASLNANIRSALYYQEHAETWEENHQILSEHYERMTHERDTWQERAEKSEQLADKFYRRALSAEQTADWFNKDRDRWMDCAHGRGSRIERADEEIEELNTQVTAMTDFADKLGEERDVLRTQLRAANGNAETANRDAETAEADCDSLKAQIRAWKEEAEKAEALAETHSDEVDRVANERDEWKDSALHWFKEWTDATLRVHEYRRRSESWWEAAKTLCRYWRMGEAEHNECLKDLMRERDRADWAKARVEILEGVSYELGQKARYVDQIRCNRDYWKDRAGCAGEGDN